jgi:hypothetical protein
MKRKKRRSSFETPEEYRAWKVQYDENTRRLQAYVEKLRAELAASGERPRGLQYWIDRGRAELEAKGQLPPA